jgi:streptogrisin B
MSMWCARRRGRGRLGDRPAPRQGRGCAAGHKSGPNVASAAATDSRTCRHRCDTLTDNRQPGDSRATPTENRGARRARLPALPPTPADAMTATPRLALTVAALAATALLTAPTGYAAAITVGPGDLIETNTASCTIAYTYTGRDDHTYAITAGHCEDTPHAAVEDQTGGAAGTFTRTVVDPPGSGGSDYGLIDFGLKPLAVHTLAQRPVASAHPEPHPGQTVCRSGITTGRHCGTIAAVYGSHQYLTDMATSRGGDSGAPVWIVADDGRAQIIGVWLGGRTTAGGDDYGRFAALADAFDTLELN